MRRLIIKALGGLEVMRDSETPPAPTRKGKALLAYLALSPGCRRSREKLADVLWGRSAEEQARASLRQTLSTLRRSLADYPGLIAGTADSVVLAPQQLDVDVLRFKALAQSTDMASLAEAADLYVGDFLEGFSLREEAFEEWAAAERRQCQALALQVLSRLVDQYVMLKEYEQGVRFAEKALALDPLREQAHRTLIELYAKLGRYESGIRQYQECARRLRSELGVDPAPETKALHDALLSQREKAAASTAGAQAPETELTQTVRYCEAEDGTRIAYAIVGRGPPLVKAANWLNHLEFDWRSPVWRHVFEFLTGGHCLIRYDERGNGLSDWNVEDMSFAAFISDLEAVVDAAGVDRFPLLGISQGCAVSVAYAVKYPHRVSHLILYGGYAQGRAKRGSVRDIEKSQAMDILMEQGWGRENPAFRQLFTTMFIPGASEEQVRWFNALQKMTTSPENVVRLRRATAQIDVTPLLSRVSVPTLVMHARGDETTPVSESEKLAALIPGARLAVLESNNHLLLAHEPAWMQFCREVTAFLAGGARVAGPTEGVRE